jgi:hypothetical protein
MRNRFLPPGGLVRTVSLAALTLLPVLLAACGKGTGGY